MAIKKERFRNLHKDVVTGKFTQNRGIYNKANTVVTPPLSAGRQQLPSIIPPSNPKGQRPISADTLTVGGISAVMSAIGLVNSLGQENDILEKVKSYPNDIMNMINESVSAAVDNIIACLKDILSLNGGVDLNSLVLTSIALLDCAVERNDAGAITAITGNINDNALKTAVMSSALTLKANSGSSVGVNALLGLMDDDTIMSNNKSVGGALLDNHKPQPNKPLQHAALKQVEARLDTTGDWQNRYGRSLDVPYKVTPDTKVTIDSMLPQGSAPSDTGITMNNTQILSALLV